MVSRRALEPMGVPIDGAEAQDIYIARNADTDSPPARFTLRVGGSIRIGRGKGNDIVMDFNGVSIYHCELTLVQESKRSAPKFCIRDDSKNGTGLRSPSVVPGTPWKQLQRGALCVLDHGWQLLVPMKGRQGENQEQESKRTLTILLDSGEPPKDIDGEGIDSDEEADIAAEENLAALSVAAARASVSTPRGLSVLPPELSVARSISQSVLPPEISVARGISPMPMALLLGKGGVESRTISEVRKDNEAIEAVEARRRVLEAPSPESLPSDDDAEHPTKEGSAPTVPGTEDLGLPTEIEPPTDTHNPFTKTNDSHGLIKTEEPEPAFKPRPKGFAAKAKARPKFEMAETSPEPEPRRRKKKRREPSEDVTESAEPVGRRKRKEKKEKKRGKRRKRDKVSPSGSPRRKKHESGKKRPRDVIESSEEEVEQKKGRRRRRR